ncbi:hypothetical protein QTP70_009855 [Hemibagrus guttatus]|uniref:ribonuclease H n=1 Tax=Hemibagrus guttatus TaxID=175788 RepID=A0AAE0Q2L3_9TELE|nr:hypothetical protein QTP70_009855 [Hemibagrus guttatus]
MKSGKAVGPDDIPVEVWKCLGEAAMEFLTSLFNRVLESERMPEEWRRSVLVPIFKNKGDVQSCSNYRGIKLMSHTMKLWERVVEARLRKVVEICEQQYGFMPRKSTTDAIFALRILMEKYRDGQRELHYVFVDLEKAYDRVPREELWYCMRKSGVAEKYVRVVQDMYERSRTVVRCAVGQTEEFKVEVGLHQGSALSPFLFAIVMDQLSEEVRQESPWTMMFADDTVICSESREQVEENLERWRFALERRGMKVSRSKTEYMCVNEREGSGTVRFQGEEVKKVQEFKYLGSTVQSNGECRKEVKKRVQAGWNGWRKVSGVLCDRKISARIKGKVYRTVVRPAMLYGLETVSLRKRQESELEVAELKMLRFSLGVTRLDRIRNEYIRGTAHVGRLGDKVREARLRWFGHVQRRESEYIGGRMLDMELPGRRQRGRPKRRYVDGINEDMKLVGASVEEAVGTDGRAGGRTGGRTDGRFAVATPEGKSRKKKNGTLAAESVPIPDLNLKQLKDFHARYRAISRTYVYRLATGICRHTELPITEKDLCWTLENMELNVDAMREAGAMFQGTHDFSTFRALSSDAPFKNPLKTMELVQVDPGLSFSQRHFHRDIQFWELTFKSRSFLYKQVRRMVGALVAVGRGKLSIRQVQDLLDSRDSMAYPQHMAAPPYGLFLINVEYSDSDLKPSIEDTDCL